MTKKTVVCANKDFEILRIDSLAAVCCGNAPFTSFCVRKKGSLRQINLSEKEYFSLKALFCHPEQKLADG
jgi:predicted metal-binding transcription factor (methanogenesis marker protein 9)